ncbi:MAG: glutaredoxin family protein [Flavobacterium sp.]
MFVKSILKIAFVFLFSQSAFSQSETTSEKKKTHKAIVYGSETCHYCIDTKKFLTENNIEYKFYDIDQDQNALKRMLSALRKASIDVSKLEIPVVIYGESIIVNGENFPQFLSLLLETIKKENLE